MVTYVLVHGGRHGGWCWRRVAESLRAAGHEVYTPTSTGLGERSHLLDRSVSLQTHIDDLTGLLRWEDLHRVVLVGHSYGGVLITGTADTLPDRVSHLVYIDALLPHDGESVLDLATPRIAEMLTKTISELGDGWLVPAVRPASEYGVVDPVDAAWVDSKLSAQPAATYLDKIQSTSAAWSLPGTFIACMRPQQVPPPVSRLRAQERAGTDSTFRYEEWDCVHDIMITDPGRVTELLLGIGEHPGCG